MDTSFLNETNIDLNAINQQENIQNNTIINKEEIKQNTTNNEKIQTTQEEEIKETIQTTQKEEVKETIPDKTYTSTEKIKIANWNLQIFGNTKASNDDLMDSYASVIDDYDIIFIQEIRNKDQTAFPKLCDLLPTYDCRVSSRAGRSSSKEQYGVIYKKGIKIADWKDYNPDSQDRWERPPIEVKFNIGGYEMTTYNIHIKPDDAPSEINYLEDIVKTSGNVIVLGDLNADCSYYSNKDDFSSLSWKWIIKDYEDTTVSTTNCAYDRIILNDDAYGEYASNGIYTQVTSDMSDHYLVWIELKLNDVSITFEDIEQEKEPEIIVEEQSSGDSDCLALGCPVGTEYVGSSESDKYHFCSCRWVKKILLENIICFTSKSDAQSQGYVPCGTCNP